MSLSVVIASFNRPETLQRAIDSALQQETAEDIIVVDDASPAGAIPKAETGGKVRVERHRENRGCCAARNTGLNRVTTEYVAFLDDDDRLPIGAYEPLLDALARFRSRSDTLAVASGADFQLQASCGVSDAIAPRYRWLERGSTLSQPDRVVFPSVLPIRGRRN